VRVSHQSYNQIYPLIGLQYPSSIILPLPLSLLRLEGISPSSFRDSSLCVQIFVSLISLPPPQIPSSRCHPTSPAPVTDNMADWQRLARDHKIEPHILTRTNLERAFWNHSSNAYDLDLTLPDGSSRKVSPRILVSAIGGFSTPLWPEIQGLDTFKGLVVHTSRWPEDLKPEQLRGKKVAVVGNACSG
jgi:cation diffusion facilitator CzcD-associated flavoprotein CzcO